MPPEVRSAELAVEAADVGVEVYAASCSSNHGRILSRQNGIVTSRTAIKPCRRKG
jgi:hypothetical protein